MKNFITKIIKFAEENDYEIVVNDGGNSENELELIVIDNTQLTVYMGQKKEYLSNPNLEE